MTKTTLFSALLTLGLSTAAVPPCLGAEDGGLAESGFEVAEGFRIEKIYSVPKETEGSWVSLAADDAGGLIASDQGDKGLYRITFDENGRPQTTKLPVDLSSAQGLLWRNGELFVSVTGQGMFRATDSDGDGLPDRKELLSAYFGRGEHGNHALIDTEDGTGDLYAVSGNMTPLPDAETIERRRLRSSAEDLLLPRQWDPRGHAAGLMAPGGWITRFNVQTGVHELHCAGFRNEYDAALNEHGDLFAFDADMEWDLGLPWYRPTRICHAVSGADFGWRSGAGKWKPYYEDSLPPVVDVGPASPTGVASGRGAKYPVKYQRAIYALDWTYGRILAIHLTPDGASYTGMVESFAAGPAFPVTDAVIGSDGAMYVTTGGRGAQSDLFRISYIGDESTAPAPPTKPTPAALTRKMLEKFHGMTESDAVATAWPYLSDEDRFIRHAARVAIESQPVDEWAEKALTEPNPQARIAAAVALARVGSPDLRDALIASLNELPAAELPEMQRLGLLR
ncbi:MAG: cytochrome C, partial [Planctomycetota bacterium]